MAASPIPGARRWAQPQEPITRVTPDGNVEIQPLSDGCLRITLKPRNAATQTEKDSCETTFPLEIIDYFIGKFPFGSLCAFITRQQDTELSRIVCRQLLSYFQPSDFRGKRLLDFGCGAGASTFGMAEALPDTEIVGIDLDPRRIEVANTLAELQNFRNTRFLLSPSGDDLPSDMGSFDFVTLTAVYEHLLPKERKTLMPLIWSAMKPGAVLFINQTPYRYFPYEHHSTGLWLINYLPDPAAHWLARKFARVNPELNRSRDWNVLLRGGIRGATESEIIRNLCARGGRAAILQPMSGQITDRASYWLDGTSPQFHALKRFIAFLFRWSDRLLGTIPSMNVDVAIRKEP